MNAEELLDEYRNGKKKFISERIINQSFQGERLIDITFQNCDLSGTNFAGCDLRNAQFIANTKILGTNFYDADLTGAYFKGVKTGLYYNWQFAIIALILFICSLSGFTSAILFTFCCYYLRRKNTLLWVVILVATAFIVFIRTIAIIYFNPTISYLNINLLNLNIGLSITAIVGFALIGIVAANVNESEAIKSMSLIIFFILLILAIFVFGQNMLSPIEQNLQRLNIVTSVMIPKFGDGNYLKGVSTGFIGAIFGGIYSEKSIRGDKEFAWMWRFFIQTLIEHCGTLFTKSQLRNADFTEVNVKGCCFKTAKFYNTKFLRASFLERADFRGTSLQKKSIQNLARTKDGCRKNFNGENLTVIDLEDAFLEEASLIGTNLIECNLKGARLQFANLKRAQLQGTILSNAILTGAYIKNWSIDLNTKLENITCPYISIAEEPYERQRPENRHEFSEEEAFANYVRTELETINIFLKSDRNDWAIAESLFQLAKNNPNEQLRLPIIEAMENGSLLIRIPVVGNKNKSALRREFLEIYNKLKNLPKQTPHKYENLDVLEKYFGISGALIVNINTNNMQKSSMSEFNHSKYDQKGSINQFVDTAQEGSNISFNQNNHTPEQKTLAEAASEIQKLLKQLEKDNPTANEAEKVAYVNEETTPSFKKRVAGAFQAGGETAIDEFILDNKYLKVAKATIKGWLQPDG
ncbi:MULTISPECIES: pentapeptide repeat-containing protein [unclassified Tolypothrix]|nr:MULTISPECIES: pentapeptide repeat-containing protein [unclassified Tolypothrix]UYD30919.1 pentapeptide repeat-containing protein [Tolypothrix sp. PCC 7712]BAY95645.1 hypothetical protein NIES3275_77220 [Microchaete diplosiphon NIES-3275]